MPNSKHRRKGKTRKRDNLKNAPQLPEYMRPGYYPALTEKGARVGAQLRKMYGDDWSNLTDAHLEAAIAEVEREEAARSNPLPDISQT